MFSLLPQAYEPTLGGKFFMFLTYLTSCFAIRFSVAATRKFVRGLNSYCLRKLLAIFFFSVSLSFFLNILRQFVSLCESWWFGLYRRQSMNTFFVSQLTICNMEKRFRSFTFHWNIWLILLLMAMYWQWVAEKNRNAHVLYMISFRACFVIILVLISHICLSVSRQHSTIMFSDS